jgi:hypothetical protein
MMSKPITRLVLPLLLITSLACEFVLGPQPGSQPPVAGNSPTHEIYAGFTQNKEMPFVMIHRSGESLVVTQDVNTSNTTGAVWTSSDGKSIVIYSDSSGLPQSAVVGKDIVQYSNYTNDTVEITIIHEDGTREAFQAQRDIDLLNKITASFAPTSNLIAYSMGNLRLSQQRDLLAWAKTGLYIVGAASCISQVPGSFAVPIVGIPLLANACAGFLLSTVVRVGNALNLDVADIQTLKDNLDIFNCAGLNLLSVEPVGRAIACGNVLVAAAEKQKAAADKMNANRPAAPLAGPPAAPSPTARPSAPPSVSMLPGTVTQLSNCRYGPDYPYLYKYGVKVGTKMEVIGRDADGNWLQVRGVGGNNPCWIKAVQMQVDGDVMGLPDAYPTTTGLPISPFFEQITLTGVSSSGGAVNVTWLEHTIRSDLDTEQGIEYIVEVWTCVNGKPNFSAIGTNDTNASFQIDNSCGLASHADVIGEDKEGFSVPAIIALP